MSDVDTVNIDYANLIDYKVNKFLNENKYCLALNKDNTRCKHYLRHSNSEHLLCKLHRNKKKKAEYIIVYIDNDIDSDDDTKNSNSKLINSRLLKRYGYNNHSHIIAYPYKNKEQYLLDIELYKKELKDIANENYIKLKNLKTCKVCCEDYENSKLIKCSKITCENKHIVCSTCIKGYIESQIISNVGTYECMFTKSEKCNGEYTITSINNILDTFYDIECHIDTIKNNEIKTKWLDLVILTDIYKLANICDDYVICPLCRKWGCIFEEDPLVKNKVYIDCHHCKLKWCNICKREAHGDADYDGGKYACYTLIFKDEEKEEQRITIIDNLIQDMISKAITHNCSTCGCAYIKEEGCNLMVCHYCGGMTCYLCNTKIYYKEDKGKYWHFAGHELSEPDTTCILWNTNPDDDQDNQGNTNYNNTKILKELILLILNNSKITGKLIYDRIIFLYEKDETFNFIVNIFEKLNKDNFNNIPQDLLTF